jgi:tetratricopeptide (TPR) repeat protein
MNHGPHNPVPNPAHRYERLLILFAALVVVLIYTNTLTGPFIFDDIINIRENPYIRIASLNYSDFKDVVTKGVNHNRPVANISFAINYYLNRYNQVGYHLINILIHITCGLLLYTLAKITLNIPGLGSPLKDDTWIPLLTALLWMVHPLQTQSVSYIVQRMNSMAAMFYVLSVVLFVKFRMATGLKKKWILFAGFILSGLLALGTKEIAATLPFFILLYEWFFFQKLSIKWLKRHAFTLIAIIIVFTLTAWIYTSANPLEAIKNGYRFRDFTFDQRMFTELRVVIFYISLILWPHPSRLNLDHDFSLSYSLFQPPTTVVCLVLIAGFISAAIYFAKRDRLLSFCIIWFFGNLVIESSVIGLELVFEHRTYLPSMLAILLIVVVVRRLIKPRWLGIGLLCAAAAVGSVWTVQRNNVWTDEIILWRDCVKKSPRKARSFNNLGLALSRQGNFKEAMANFDKALALKPNYAQPHYNLGLLLAKLGKLSQGIQYLQTAVQIDPYSHKAHNGLGAVLLVQGDLDSAAVHLKQALKIAPDYPEAHNNLGLVMQRNGDLAAAIDHFSAAVRLDLDYAKAHNNLGIALRQTGRFEEAKKHFEQALRVYPGYTEARRNLQETIKEMEADSIRKKQN